MNLRETYNAIAEAWHKDHSADDWWVEGTEAFISTIPEHASILDVGCGSGVKSKYLANKGLRVTGIDFSDKLIEIARREVPNAQFQIVDMRDLDARLGPFDGIFAQASLLHIPKNEIRATLEKLATRLSIGGCFYIAVKGMRPDGKEEEILTENDYGYPYQRFFSYYSMDELRAYLTDLKLTIIYEDSKLVGKTVWLQIVGKKSL